jgi:hypothetical protein
MIHSHWHRIAHHDSQPQAQKSSPWFTPTGIMLSQWFWIIVCYAEQWLVVNHGVIWWASGCEPLCAMLSQWVVLNHDVLCWASGCESFCAMTSWFTTTGTEELTMIHNHWLSISHDDSNPLAQYNTTLCKPVSGFESWCAMLSQWWWIMVCNAVPVVVSHGVVYWTSRFKSWYVMLS